MSLVSETEVEAKRNTSIPPPHRDLITTTSRPHNTLYMTNPTGQQVIYVKEQITDS